MIETGQRLPSATLLRKGPDGIAEVDLGARLSGKRVILFAVPGAFTPTCDSAHMPSFVRTADRLRELGVDEIVCVSVNDAHVMHYWGETTGAAAAGITLLADADGAFTRSLGLTFSNPAAGMFDRSRRYAMLLDDGIVTTLFLEQPGVCEVSTGEAMLAALEAA